MLSQFSCLDTTRNKAPCTVPVDLNTMLKGLCHDDIAVLGQFCAEVITISAFTNMQNSPVELRGRYQ